MQGCTIQIQTVVYKLDQASLLRSLESIKNAIRINRAGAASVAAVKVVHGDSSPAPVFTASEAREVRERYASWFDYEYRFFNENTGTARGHNTMFQTCTSDYVVVQNPDIQYAPWFFERMLEPFARTDVKAGLVEARQTPIEHPKEYNKATKETPWSTSACIMVPSAVWREVGGFDADTFFLYCDDVDFSWRVRLAGYSLIYQPLAPVYHPKYLTSQGHWQATVAEEYYSAVAQLLMAHKWSYDAHCKRLLGEYQASRDETRRRAAAEFVERRDQGRLPVQLDPAHRVADINDKWSYSSCRFAI